MNIITKKDIYEAVKQVMTQDFGITQEVVTDMMKSTVAKMIDKASGKVVNNAIQSLAYKQFQKDKSILQREIRNEVAKSLVEKIKLQIE